MYLCIHKLEIEPPSAGSTAAASIEPLHRPDYKAKKHSRPRGEERRRWVRAPRKAWVAV